MEETDNYNSQFWSRLQNEWKKISEEDDQSHPWLSEFSDYYDPYKVGVLLLFFFTKKYIRTFFNTGI